VDNVKAARDGTIPEYFDAVKNLEKMATPLSTGMIQMTMGDKNNKKDNRGDLLLAAKEMCLAMKNVQSLITL